MSVVVAQKLKNNKGWVIGAESYIGSHGRKEVSPGIKIFHPDDNTDIIVGLVGYAGDANILEATSELIDYQSIRRESLSTRNIVNHTVKKIQDKLREFGRLELDSGKFFWESNIIICHKDKAFEISPDFTVVEIKEFQTIGFPESFVHGMDILYNSLVDNKIIKEIDAEAKVVEFIKLAIDHCEYVSYPITIMNSLTQETKTYSKADLEEVNPIKKIK